MCLTVVDPEPKTNRKTGYKVVDRRNGRLYPPCRGITPYEVGRWMIDPEHGKIRFEHSAYPTGYHIFLSLAGAKAWSAPRSYVVKVSFNNVVATGTQRIWSAATGYRHLRVIVARKLFIPKKEFANAKNSKG